MENINAVLFYTLEKSIKVYRKYAQTQIANAGFDITIDQWLVLKSLQENSHLSQNEIADLVFKDMASITRIIELLVKKELVERHINNSDRRKFELKITKNGKKMIELISPIVKNNRKQALKGITKLEQNNLTSRLEILINNCN
ncbi:MAG: MarR family transcriptional regulator [Chitinophagaceae bacterium]|jgi:DNA-binding MarR family transcriptional regulator|nr:MarR family transcriptional regulator [Chitinophagaceae bacterium]MBP6372195.1 MarR family transcriptional regulator [Ferruginibacter sp.]MBP6659942.1 MarR family transcriptional regulator [Chitinophagales bacterium]MBK7088307.1 MarR family transcriptional regulator [Chitinophagaceae bacterium]MBK7347063.1 MarR family transcriptional regulator [Chitinophagaceae bacterium]